MHKLTLIFLFISFFGQTQLTKKIVDNGSNPEYRICHTKTVHGAMLKLENVDGVIAFYIQGNYTCDDEVNVELSFLVDEQNKSYSLKAL